MFATNFLNAFMVDDYDDNYDYATTSLYNICAYLHPHPIQETIIGCSDKDLIQYAYELLEYMKQHTGNRVLSYHETDEEAIEFAFVLRHVMPDMNVVGPNSDDVNVFDVLCLSNDVANDFDIAMIDAIMFHTPGCEKIYDRITKCDIIIPTLYEDENRYKFLYIVDIMEELRKHDDTLVYRFLSNVKYDDEVTKHLTECIMKSNELLFDYKMHLLFEFCDMLNRMPTHKESYKGMRLGKWAIKNKTFVRDNNRDDIYDRLTKHHIVKESFDRFLKKKKNSHRDDKPELLKRFCDEYGRVPKQKEKIDGENIGRWLTDQKKNITSKKSEAYKKLVTLSPHVAACLDEYLRSKETKPVNRMPGIEIECALREFITEHGRVPKQKERWRNMNIGMMWSNRLKLVKHMYDPQYEKLLKIHPIVKKVLDNWVTRKRNPEYDEWISMIRAYIKEHKRLPVTRERYEGRIPRAWLANQRDAIKSRNDERYEKLVTIHPLVRKYVNEKIKK